MLPLFVVAHSHRAMERSLTRRLRAGNAIGTCFERRFVMRIASTFVPAMIAGFLGASAAPALAAIPEGDVFLSLEGGQLKTGLISEDGTEITPGLRVTFAEFGVDVPNITDEPGVQSLAGGLGSATSFSFDIRKAVRKWNGSDFTTLDGSVTADLGPLSVTSPLTDVLTPGFSIALDPSGSHEHPDWTLNAPATDGVYLVEVQWSLNTGEVSPFMWMLWAQNTDEATNEAAYDWAVANVPTPGSAGLLALAGLVAARRRRVATMR
jgi:MYXO-CTERM domain-containing protein